MPNDSCFSAFCNFAILGCYHKNPSGELKTQILANDAKVSNPTDKLTKELKGLGIQ